MEKQIFKFRISKTLVFLYCLLALSASMLVYTGFKINSIIYRQSLNYGNHTRYLLANAKFRHGTDLLTDAVRRYVVTRDVKFMRQYFYEDKEGRHRDQALEMIRNLQIEPALRATIAQANTTSRNLMALEYRAMHLIAIDDESAHEELHRDVGAYHLSPDERKMSAAARRALALDLLWSEEYIRHKNEIYSFLSNGLDKAGDLAMTRHMQLRRELIHTLIGGAVSLIVLVLTTCGLVFYRRYQRERIIAMQADENARMNVQLTEERDRALKAEKARSYFFSTVSHDIRTPLNSIIGFSEMLQLGIDDPEEKERALEAIITSGQTLLELINDVLDLSKLESGKMELHPVPTNIATLVEKVANSFKVATSRTSVPIRTEVAKMPYLKLDPQRIRQILFNLIGNAVKFTAKGVITVRASYDDGAFELSVLDTGCGISEENIKKLMSPYVQLQTHDSTTGTGLGLAICKQLSKQMKGTLELDSVVGQGSKFTLRIPNVQAFSEAESDAYMSEHHAPEEIAQLDESVTNKCILIVDDQKLNRRILQTMLGRLGIHNLLTADNGKEALEVLKDPGNVDIVLTDMTMPVMDGAALVSEIRKSPQFAEIPVCVITADVEMQGKYGEMGFDEMLIKPVTFNKLKELLGKYSPHRTDAADATGGEKA